MTEKQLRDNELYESRFGFKERNSSFRFYVVLLAIFCLFFGFRVYFTSKFGGVIVDGESMCETLYDGEELLMRYVDGNTKAKRGDVIIVSVSHYEEFQGTTTKFLVKRLIATAGDSLRCEDGKIYIRYAESPEDGYVKLDEPYAHYIGNPANYDFGTYDVEEGEIFFLGDNRQNSTDSRYKEGGSRLNGLYKETDIYGVVPDWAIKYQKLLQIFFFAGESLSGK